MKLDENGGMVEFRDFSQLETERLIFRGMTLDDAEFTAFEGPRDIQAATEELTLYCIEKFDMNTGIR